MARITLLIYGIINLLGGAMGTVMTSRSGKPEFSSLIAGGTAGLILIALFILVPKKPAMAYRTAGVLTLVLLGFWVTRVMRLMAEDRSIMMAAGNIGLAVIVLGVLAYAHFAAQKAKAVNQA